MISLRRKKMVQTVEVPELRVRSVNSSSANVSGDFVLYWMVANRRLSWNYSLDRAVQWSQKLNKPLLILEALRVGYRWASDRIHGFVIQGMADNQTTANQQGLSYYPYLEPSRGSGSGLIQALAAKAAVVVSDDFPCFFLPSMVRAASRQIPCLFELVDSNGILPMRAADKVFSRAYDFRRYLQKNLGEFLLEAPRPQAPDGRMVQSYTVPQEILQQWPAANLPRKEETASWLADFPIDHQVTPSMTQGGTFSAAERLQTFMDNHLRFYGERRSDVVRWDNSLTEYSIR